MFNSKRIIFLIGLLSIVALTGALMAGPAFAGQPAGKGKNGTASDDAHRTNICHYQEYSEAAYEPRLDPDTGEPVLDEAGNQVMDLVKEEEMEEWQDKWVDADSVDKHMANHGDFVIDFEDEGADDEFGDYEGQTGVNDSGADCSRLQAAL